MKSLLQIIACCAFPAFIGLSGVAHAQDVVGGEPATGTPITANELEVTGRTMEKGKHLVSIAGRYRYGVTDWFQTGSTAYLWAAGPNANIGFTPFANDKHAVSLEIDGLADYSFSTRTVSANLIYSLGPAVGSRLNAGVAFSIQRLSSTVEPSSADPNFPDPPALDLSRRITSLPLHVGYDLAFSEVQVLRFWFDPYLMYSVDTDEDNVAPFVFNSGVAFMRGYERVRVAGGVSISNAGVEVLRELEALALEWGAQPPTVPDVVPMPYIRLYWML